MKMSIWIPVSEVPITFNLKAITVEALTYTLKIDDLGPTAIFHML